MERPDPAGEAYMWGTPEYRASVDAQPERRALYARTREEDRVRDAMACVAEVSGYASLGGPCRCGRPCMIVLGPVGPLCERHALAAQS
jgi:hypothetical protein